MQTIEGLKPYIDRASSNFGIVLFDFDIIPEDHKLLKIAPQFLDSPNAVASIDERALYVSPALLKHSRQHILAAIAHELAHLILCHDESTYHKDEYEADMTALEILRFWNVPQRALVEFFKSLGKDFLKESPTHPGGLSRIDYLEGLIRNARKE